MIHIETGNTNIDYTFVAPRAGDWSIKEIRLTIDGQTAGGANSFTIKLLKSDNTDFSHLLATQDMTSVYQYRYIPTGNLLSLSYLNDLKFEWTNGGSLDWTIEIFYN